MKVLKSVKRRNSIHSKTIDIDKKAAATVNDSNIDDAGVSQERDPTRKISFKKIRLSGSTESIKSLEGLK